MASSLLALTMILFLASVAVTNIWVDCYNEKWAEEDDNSKYFPKNDFSRLFSDIKNKLGMENMIDKTSYYLHTSIKAGQVYTRKDLNKDWKMLKEDLSFRNCCHFTHQLMWSSIAKSCAYVINFLSQVQKFLLHFLKRKCDHYMGKDASLHPWNIMMNQDKQQVSFLVFVYGLALSLIVIKLLSWWNFAVYLALSFIAYSVGGPYLVFKGLLCITSFFWFMFDLILQYPLHVAILTISIYALSFIKRVFALPANRNTPPQPHLRQQKYITPVQHVGNDYNGYKVLTARVDGMERKTDILNDRLEKLSRSMERLLQSDDEDDV